MIKRLSGMILACLFAVIAAPSDVDASINSITKQVTFAQFSTAATTNNVELYKCPNDCSVHQVVMIRDVDFAGGAISAYTVSVGKTAATTKYQSATDVFTGVSNGTTNAIVTTGPGAEAAGASIRAYATSTTANLDAATAGKLTFKIYVSAL